MQIFCFIVHRNLIQYLLVFTAIMLWSPNEVLAYMKDEVNVTDKKEIGKFSKTSSFGGFPVCVLPEQDFVFIAENSEIYGPNPLVIF